MGLMNQREKCILRKPDRVDLCSQFATILAGGVPLASLLVARGGYFFASSRPTLPFTSTLVLRMRCSRVRRFLSEYPAFDFQLLTSPRGAFLVPIPARNPFKHLHLQLSLDRDRNHVVICSLILRRQPAHSPLASRHSAARAFSFTSFTSFASLTSTSSKPFIIRTSKTPLPQLLYNPHLQAPLGSAGNKGLITPLES